jgi:hypothetical protein
MLYIKETGDYIELQDILLICNISKFSESDGYCVLFKIKYCYDIIIEIKLFYEKETEFSKGEIVPNPNHVPGVNDLQTVKQELNNIRNNIALQIKNKNNNI